MNECKQCHQPTFAINDDICTMCHNENKHSEKNKLTNSCPIQKLKEFELMGNIFTGDVTKERMKTLAAGFELLKECILLIANGEEVDE